VRRFDTPLAADPASRFDLLWPGGDRWIDQPFANHNGGDLVFGSDGYLYIGLGDGGGGNDPAHRAQDPTTLLGKMLRIDVNVPDSDPEGYDVPPSNPFVSTAGVLPEIWAFGLRNPWRVTVDAITHGGTGALVIADVGQSDWEEINYEPAFSGGRNYGWRNREGAHPHIDAPPPFPAPIADPLFEYDHTVGDAIIGGHVYRGHSLGAAFVGRYFFGDISRNRIWSLGLHLLLNGEAIAGDLIEHTGALGEASLAPSSFGMDASGEIYVLSYGPGRLYRLVGVGGGAGDGSACPTPDPFVAFGGGVCVSGGWLPADHPAATGGSTGSTGGGTSGGSSSGSGCTTPDPFAAFGGGSCVNGGWLPADHPAAAGGSTGGGSTGGSASGGSSTGGSPTPSSSPGCALPDPFTAFGGGVCVGGGWLPADHPAAAGGSGSGGGSSPSPGPTPSSAGCTIPDPFVFFGGGMCVNGGWLPPGYPIVPSSGSP
jgi:hypothetical protein